MASLRLGLWGDATVEFVVVVCPGVPTGSRLAGPVDCTVVKVVARDRTDGAGDENVLPAPPWELMAPPAVLLVLAADESALVDRAVSEWVFSGSAKTADAPDFPVRAAGA